jgi:hypothetical protein
MILKKISLRPRFILILVIMEIFNFELTTILYVQKNVNTKPDK